MARVRLFMAAVMAVLLLALCARSQFSASMLRLLDFNVTRGTWLFRSNDPLTANGTAFALSELADAMAVAAAEDGQVFPPTFFVLDLCLMSDATADDRPSIRIERAYFSENPSQGAFVNWPLLGALDNPMDLDPLARRALARALPDDEIDRLVSRVSLVRSWVHTGPPPVDVPDGTPLVVLIHCLAGCDRTGELSGAYTLARLGAATNMTGVLAENDAICGRAELKGNVYAIDWYCWYLNYFMPGYESLDCAF